MPSSFLGINTAYTGLTYFQAGSNTTAHNIANSNVDGYTRQKVVAKASNALRVNQTYGMIGSGITTTGIDQIRDAYYDAKYRLNVAKQLRYTIQNDYYLQFQSYVDEMASESGYTKMLSEISDAMEDLSINPSGDTERTQYTNSLKSYTDLVNEIANNLQQSQTDANDEIEICVGRVNSIAQQLYKLGQQITTLEADGSHANDLRDQRNLLLDELAGLVNIDIKEANVTYGVGEQKKESPATTLEVRINGQLLVDAMGFRQLEVVPRPQNVNQNDVDGLVDVYWDSKSGGQLFDLNSSTMTGKLKGLYEIRDGNNCENLQGKVSGVTASDVTVKLNQPMRIEDLNVNAQGSVLLNYAEYFYDTWDATYETNAKGEKVITEITFKNLKYRVTADDASEDPTLTEGTLATKDMTAINPPLMGHTALQGRAVDSMGVPYYMQQLNEFVRTLSEYMNNIHTKGADQNGNPGLDLFTAIDTNGDDFVMTGVLPDAGVMSSGDSSYWRLNALNWNINTQILDDNSKVVVSYLSDVNQNNVEARRILDDIMYGFTDVNMFKQGTPFQFMNTISSSIAIDTLRTDMFIENLDHVVNSIDTQRQSVSNVDTNEEASNLIIFRNGYNLNSKVLSTLNEMLNKLINETGL